MYVVMHPKTFDQINVPVGDGPAEQQGFMIRTRW